MTERMKTLLLDVDGVLADCATPVHRAAERILGRKVAPIVDWHTFEFGPSMGLTVKEELRLHSTLLAEDDVGWQIQPYPGASDFVRELLDLGYDVAAVTAGWRGMHSWVTAREELIKECFSDIDVIFAHAKHRVEGDFLVDDKATTIERAGTRGILFDQPWNRNSNHPRRAKSYAEVLEMIK